jgi:formylmethanofuran dehydrogenase subunit D
LPAILLIAIFFLHLSKERTPIASTIIFVPAVGWLAKVAKGQTDGCGSAPEMSGMKYRLF